MKELMSAAVISGLQPSSDPSDGVRCRMKRAAVTPAASEVTSTAHTSPRPAALIVTSATITIKAANDRKEKKKT